MTDAGQKRNSLAAACACAVMVAACLFPVIAFALSPEPPTSLSVTPGSAEPVIAKLSWTPSPDSAVVGYNVYSAVDASGPFRLAAETTETTASISDGLAGIPYFFRVTAIDRDGAESSYISAGPVVATWPSSPHLSPTSDTRMCGTCHSVHQADSSRLYRWEVGASKSQVMCLTCHDGRNTATANVASGTRDSFALNSGHSIEPTSPSHTATARGCESCHELHGSSERARRIPARKVNGRDVSSAGPELCFACHTQSADWFGPGYPESSNPTRDATGYPIAGTWPGRGVYESATNAHRLLPEATRTPTPGEPIKRQAGDCLYCHAAHRGRNAYDGLLARFSPSTSSTVVSDQTTGGYASVCFGCHGGVRPTGFSTPTVNIKQFATAPSTTAGHRVKSAGGVLPVGAPLPCYECHNPHGSARDNKSLISDTLGMGLETSSAQGVREFCFSCHTTSDTASGWDSEATTFTAVSATATVVGLRRDGETGDVENALHLPTGIVGHTQASTISCYDCHGDTYAAGGHNVHDPSSGDYDISAHTAVPVVQIITIGGASYAPSCTDCHETELSTEHGKATSSSAVSSCDACHPTPRDTLAPWDRSCAQGGCHTLTSTAPMHSEIETAHASLPVNSDCTSGTACHGGDLASMHSGASTSVVSPVAILGEGGVPGRLLAALRSTADTTTTTSTSCMVCHAAGIPATRVCIECHVGFSHDADPQMAAELAAHVATPASETVTISGETFGPVACADCHAPQLVISSAVEHQGDEPCATCHPTPKNTLTPVWDKSCDQGGCHTAGSAAPMHASIDASHAPVAGQTCYATGCHPATGSQSLGETHRNASAVLGGSTRTSCQVCHWNGTPASRACDSCHADRVDGTHS